MSTATNHLHDTLGACPCGCETGMAYVAFPEGRN
jgi:hypothetical protein